MTGYNPQTGPEYRTTMARDPIGAAVKAFNDGDIRSYFHVYRRSIAGAALAPPTHVVDMLRVSVDAYPRQRRA